MKALLLTYTIIFFSILIIVYIIINSSSNPEVCEKKLFERQYVVPQKRGIKPWTSNNIKEVIITMSKNHNDINIKSIVISVFDRTIINILPYVKPIYISKSTMKYSKEKNDLNDLTENVLYIIPFEEFKTKLDVSQYIENDYLRCLIILMENKDNYIFCVSFQIINISNGKIHSIEDEMKEDISNYNKDNNKNYQFEMFLIPN